MKILPLERNYFFRYFSRIQVIPVFLVLSCDNKSIHSSNLSASEFSALRKKNSNAANERSKLARAESEANRNNGLEQGGNAPKSMDPSYEAKALQFLNTKCIQCHGEGLPGANYWTLKKGTTTADLQADQELPKVYLALVRKYNGSKSSSPSAMPPGSALNSEDKVEFSKVILWLQENFPKTVKEAHAIAPDSVDFGEKVTVMRDFQCESPLSLRKFLRRLSNDALGQEPLATDSEAFPAKDLDLPATTENKKLLIAKLFKPEDPWNKIFVERGLKKFAMYLSGGASIKSDGKHLTSAVAADLQFEFHQLLKKYYDVKTYKEILLMNKVMVTSNTHGLYGTECKAPPAKVWAECTLSPERGNFFGTAGFLASKPSSFIENNNNYGRMAAAYLVLNGISLKPDSNAKGGGPGIPLPACFKTKDVRATLKVVTDPNSEIASYGTAAIPKVNSLCPACHIDKNLALGSIIFRPFGPIGELLTAKIIKDHNPTLNKDEKTNPYFSLLQSATEKGRINEVNGIRTPLTVDALASFLDKDSEEGCIDNTKVKNVGEAFELLIGDGSVLINGLSQHLPISLSNIAGSSTELDDVLRDAWNSGGGKLSSLIEAYFSSETYSCSEEGTKP